MTAIKLGDILIFFRNAFKFEPFLLFGFHEIFVKFHFRERGRFGQFWEAEHLNLVQVITR